MKSLLLQVFDILFGCHHRLSRVFTIQRRTYQVCFDCGMEFGYSWELMRSLPPADIANALWGVEAQENRRGFGELIGLRQPWALRDLLILSA
jgi:hypothetical protein